MYGSWLFWYSKLFCVAHTHDIFFLCCFSLSFIFGAITILAGIVGLSMGFFLSKILRKKFPRADPIICGVGLLLSAPLLLASSLTTTRSSIQCFILLLLGEIALNLNWAICGDILLVRLDFQGYNCTGGRISFDSFPFLYSVPLIMLSQCSFFCNLCI